MRSGSAMTRINTDMPHSQRHAEAAAPFRFTAHCADQEIVHLERMIRSPHWHRNHARQAPYWRRRVEVLQRDADLLPHQRARLDALLIELASVADVRARAEEPAANGERRISRAAAPLRQARRTIAIA
jgi:hypothetical protein